MSSYQNWRILYYSYSYTYCLIYSLNITVQVECTGIQLLRTLMGQVVAIRASIPGPVVIREHSWDKWYVQICEFKYFQEYSWDNYVQVC